MLATLLASILALAGDGELVNGGFEKGGAKAYLGWETIWPRSFTPEPIFAFVEDGPRSGERSAQIHTGYAGGYTSFTQEVRVPKRARAARLAGWVRVLEGGPAAFSASVMLGLAHKDGQGFDVRMSTGVTRVGDWEEVAIEVMLPEDVDRVLVRCGVSGPARVRFDDVELTWSDDREPLVATRLGFAEAWYDLTGGGAQTWAQFAVPLPFEGQIPLALELESEPAGHVLDARVVPERENRLLRVRVMPPADGERLRARTWVLFDEPASDAQETGARVRLAAPGKLPDDVRAFLASAPGVESEAEAIVAAAKRFGRKDLANLIADLCAFLEQSLDAGSGPQGALESLERGSAACTGHANLGTALLLAAEVPARILACVLVGQPQQEHYIVQVWTPQTGWQRVETTLELFPVSPSMHAVLRVVYPDSPRGTGSVPLDFSASQGAVLRPARGAYEDEGCWQTAEHRESALLSADDRALIDRLARARFESLADTPASEFPLRLASEDEVRGRARLERLLRALEGHLAEDE